MDWLKDFEQRFNGHSELQTLKADGFHGAVEINFSDGVPMNYNYKLHRRPKYREMKATLTEGGANV